jgi:hypothetical protein
LGPEVQVEGDNAIADFRWPLAMVLTAVAVAIVGVVMRASTAIPEHLPMPEWRLRLAK